MNQAARLRYAEIAIAGAMIVVGGLAVWGSRGLPPPMLEPVGPAAFPLWAGGALAALSLMVLVRAVRRRIVPDEPGADEPGSDLSGARPRRDLGLVTAALTVLYVAVMDWGWLGFRWATVAYTFVLISVLFGFRPRMLVPAAVVALAMGIGLHLLFTKLFYIDLPS